MTCSARTYADGSWYCRKCGIGGDADEPTDLYCGQNDDSRKELERAEKDARTPDRRR